MFKILVQVVSKALITCVPSTPKRAFCFVLEIFFKVYYHGHKPWDAFALFVGLFSIHTFPTLPPPPPYKQLWTCVSTIFFSEVQHCIGWVQENCKKVSIRMHCFMREPGNDRKLWTLRHCPMDFCPGLELQSVIVLYRNRAQTKKFGTLLSSLKDT